MEQLNQLQIKELVEPVEVEMVALLLEVMNLVVMEQPTLAVEVADQVVPTVQLVEQVVQV